MKPHRHLAAISVLVFALGALGACGDHDSNPPPTQPFVLNPSGVRPTLTALTSAAPGTSNGQAIVWNGAAWVLDDQCSDPSLRWCMKEEFETYSTNCTLTGPYFNGTATGTGATCAGTTLDGHPGIWTGSTGTTGTGGVRFTTNTTSFTFGANFGQSCAAQLVYVPVLSTTVIEFLIRIGWQDQTTTANSVDAVQAVYDRVTNGDFWALETSSNSSRTMKKCDGTGGTTSAPVQAATWVTLMECVDADGLTARLFVNGTQCATQTATIPTGTARAFGLGAQIVNNSGSVPASESVYLDYYRATVPFGVAR